jgi:8-amino-7-oxononanoate synthase
MTSFEQELQQRVGALRNEGLYRELRTLDSPQAPRIQTGGQWLLNFSSNDYLGLANDPVIKEAAIHAIEKYGAGAGASRLISGSLAPHKELEQALSEFKRTEAALVFSTGYGAALGAICALIGTGDVIVVDKLVHACIIDAARLSGAKVRVFDHNDLDQLESILQWAGKRQPSTRFSRDTSPATPGPSPGTERPRALIVTESVFSMDGDCAPLPEIVDLKENYGAWLMVDEAHATGLYGKTGCGLAEARGVSDRIEIQMGTLGKALGAAGGFICGSSSLIDYLINRARTFIFSTAPVPAAVAAALEGVKFVQSPAGETRRNLLWQRVWQARKFLAACSGDGSSRADKFLSAILPLRIGSERKAVEAAAWLRSAGIYIPAIRYPAVARNQARLRLTLTAAHSARDLEDLEKGLGELARKQLADPAASSS